MKRSARLAELVEIVRDGRLHLARDLAEALGVSLRTISGVLKQRETVAGETPARLATSTILAFRFRFMGAEYGIMKTFAFLFSSLSVFRNRETAPRYDGVKIEIKTMPGAGR